MVTVKGRDGVRRFFDQLPDQIETKLLRGAARAAATVVADDAKERSVSPEVTAAIKVATKREPGRVIAKVQVKMGGYNLPLWLEYGTSEHFISVDDSQRDGKSVRRINDLNKAGSLVIGGKFVGTTVHHPGARPHPFLRPALDTQEQAAIAAAQSFINARVTRGGIVGAADEGDEA